MKKNIAIITLFLVLSVILFFSAEMGAEIITGITGETLVSPVPPSTGNLLDSLTFLFNIAVYGITTFAFLITVSSDFQLLFAFIILPLTFGMALTIVEIARGNG